MLTKASRTLVFTRSMYNKIVLVGRVGKDSLFSPSNKEGVEGGQVRFTLATNYSVKENGDWTGNSS